MLKFAVNIKHTSLIWNNNNFRFGANRYFLIILSNEQGHKVSENWSSYLTQNFSIGAYPKPVHRAGWSGGKVLNLNSGDTLFESRQGHWLSWLRSFVVSLSPSRKIPDSTSTRPWPNPSKSFPVLSDILPTDAIQRRQNNSHRSSTRSI
jgi:hypothetical protein